MNKKLQVVVYSNPGCTKCAMTKRLFKHYNVNFLELDIKNDLSAEEREVIKNKGYTVAPIVTATYVKEDKLSSQTSSYVWCDFQDKMIKEIAELNGTLNPSDRKTKEND